MQNGLPKSIRSESSRYLANQSHPSGLPPRQSLDAGRRVPPQLCGDPTTPIQVERVTHHGFDLGDNRVGYPVELRPFAFCQPSAVAADHTNQSSNVFLRQVKPGIYQAGGLIEAGQPSQFCRYLLLNGLADHFLQKCELTIEREIAIRRRSRALADKRAIVQAEIVPERGGGA